MESERRFLCATSVSSVVFLGPITNLQKIPDAW